MKAWLGHRIHFHVAEWAQVSAGCWQERSVLQQVHGSMVLLECPHAMAASSHHGKRRSARQKPHIFYDPASKVTHCDFSEILLVTNVSPVHSGKTLHVDVNTRRESSTAGSHLEGQLTHNNLEFLTIP